MPTSIRATPLCRYHYDPLDRLVDCTAFEQSATWRFYCKNRLANEIQGAVQRTIVQHDDQLLAQQQREDGKVAATLLATDQQRSILNALDANQPHPLAYTPYGHRPAENGLLSLLGFNGERPDPVTGHYHLGKGYRQFNPVLMRFNSPDRLSPFGEGGLNAYAYCSGDPVNFVDPTGNMGVLPSQILKNYIKEALKHANTRKPFSKLITKSIRKTGKKPATGKIPDTKIQKVREIIARDVDRRIDGISKLEQSSISQIPDHGPRAAQAYENLKNNPDIRLNSDGVPSPRLTLTKPGVDGKEILDTDHFDITIAHFHNKAVAGDNRNHWEILAGNAIYKRAKYIRQHSKPAK
ncbi:RHS repeat-associated core domain-containing protein [Pseudomonas fluorescens]|uniref:RHS repeat-associated core domain-containing protein n=1 Tax=Pseudomonas fluorescens TaxID=294 RepID=A0A5E7C6C8_PSEFL|nr:RHS repeat-associated core domain-containing protein [Pseudomonas fluorescens]VVN99785.1 hypothetical protein PS710_02557 [Pseudomonas fluorescens]